MRGGGGETYNILNINPALGISDEFLVFAFLSLLNCSLESEYEGLGDQGLSVIYDRVSTSTLALCHTSSVLASAMTGGIWRDW